MYPTFLSPVLLSTGVQRSMSLICTPMRTDQAARDIRKKKTEYVSDAAQRARIGQIEDASQRAEYQDVLQQEADLTAGHGVLRYTGPLSVSAPTVAELDAAVAAIEQAETARTTLRLLAEATRHVDDPDQLYAVIDDIRGGVQALQETLAQLADAHMLYQARAISLNGDPVTGQATAADAHTALQGADGDPARRQNRVDDDATAQRTRIVRHDKPHDDIEVTVCVHYAFTESIVSTKRH